MRESKASLKHIAPLLSTHEFWNYLVDERLPADPKIFGVVAIESFLDFRLRGWARVEEPIDEFLVPSRG